MKITPMATGSGEPGHTLGQTEIATTNAQGVEETSVGMGLKRRRMVMKTNHSTPNYMPDLEEEGEVAALTTEKAPAISDPIEGTQGAEETKPLSPQLAALARQRREVQRREQAVQAKERALAEKEQGQAPSLDFAKLKADPLGVLRQAGVSYDDLTSAILQSPIPTNTVDTASLKEELLAAIKQDLNKNLEDRDSQTEKEVLNQIRREASLMAERSEDFELVKATKSIPDVVELIHRTYKKTGEVLDTEEALKLIEDDLAEQLTPLAQSKKIQGRLRPSKQAPKPQQMRTLTNRDAVQSPMSTKQRAMAAFYGQLKK